jgi:hypothetical protein
VVLCHVVNELPELFDELDDKPLYRTKLTAIREWIDDHRHDIYGFMDQPRGLLEAAGRETIGTHLDAARDCLLGAGMDAERVTCRIIALERDRASTLVATATGCGYETLVVGRLGLIGFIEAVFGGRVSQKVLKMADELTGWIV